MAYPLYSRLMEFRGESAQLLNGGRLDFYETDTTTPKAVYADFALTMTNGSTVDLDASSRMNEAAFGSGSYYVKLFDAANVQQGEDTLYEPGGAALSIPIPNPGEYITGDGSQLLVDNLSTRLVPDATGHGADILGSDGNVPVWVAKPADGAPGAGADQDVGTSSVRIGNFLIQRGTGTAPATGELGSSVGIAFSTAYTALWHVDIEITVAGVSSLTPPGLPASSVTGYTPGSAASNATVNFRIATDSGDGSSNNINNPVPFTWVAFGLIAA